MLTICGDSAAVFEAATAVHVNVSTAAQSLVCVGGRSNIAFQRARFHGNIARCISVPQQPSNSSAWLHLTKCVFANNSAPVDVGGALAMASGTALVESSTFSGNSVQDRGGAIGVMSTARATIISSLFQQNTGRLYQPMCSGVSKLFAGWTLLVTATTVCKVLVCLQVAHEN